MDNVGHAVDELIRLIDDHNYSNRGVSLERFDIKEIRIVRTKAFSETVTITAIDGNGKTFKYAMYLDHSGNIIADGI